MKRRLFIAIPLPEQIRKEIHYALDRIDPEIFLAGKEVEDKNWHITLNFLGEQDEEKIPQIISVLKEAAREGTYSKILVTLKHIDFESIEKRMMWVHGDKASSEGLGKIREYISHRLSDSHIHARDDFDKFTMHITLMRFPRRPHRDIHIHEELGVSFPVGEIDLMESELSESGAEYTLLHSEKFL